MNSYSDDDKFDETSPAAAATSFQLPPPPSLAEITQLTHSELTRRNKNGTNIDDGTDADAGSIHDSEEIDTIEECGLAAMNLLTRDPKLCLDLAYQHLHDVPYREVRTCWRRLYVDAALWVVLGVAERVCLVEGGVGKRGGGGGGDGEESEEDWVTEVVKTLDMALILTGAPGREELIELWFSALESLLASTTQTRFDKESPPHPNLNQHHHSPPSKKRKLNASPTIPTPIHLPQTFPTTLTHRPHLKHPIPTSNPPPSLSSFQTKVSNPTTQTPLIIHGAISHWPALDERPWNSPEYLLSRTLGGCRLVPVEVGRSYTDDGWGQKVIRFGDFLREYMLDSNNHTNNNEPLHKKNKDEKQDDEAVTTTTTKKKKTGYLAQHDLFAQIPSLRADISIPDYCFTSPCPPSPPSSSASLTSTSNPLPTPLLNAWFGPPHTISPLHTDPYHNMLAQVVGYKYLRLYAPSQGARMYARGVEAGGVDMSNTSRVDLDVAMRVWPGVSCWGDTDSAAGEGEVEEGLKKEYETRFPAFRDAEYVEGVLGPGDCVYVPLGWWHYVRSLTGSFSVSFWFS